MNAAATGVDFLHKHQWEHLQAEVPHRCGQLLGEVKNDPVNSQLVKGASGDQKPKP